MTSILKNNAHAEMFTRLQETSKKILPQNAHVYLFGSRARNNAQENSDWDMLLLLEKPKREFSNDFDCYAWPLVEIGLEYGQVLNFSIHTMTDWEKGKWHPFYKNVMNERIKIA